MSIACAKCHNHPMEKWTNDQYYQMANLFARVRVKSGSRDGENIIFTADQGDLVQPLRGKPQPPAPLDAHAVADGFPGRPPPGAGRLDGFARQPLLQPRHRQSNLGQLFRRRAWWRTWMICARPIPPATKNCSPPRPVTWPTTDSI